MERRERIPHEEMQKSKQIQKLETFMGIYSIVSALLAALGGSYLNATTIGLFGAMSLGPLRKAEKRYQERLAEHIKSPLTK